MVDAFPDQTDSPEDSRARIFSEVFFGRSWSRTLPADVLAILGPLVVHGAMTREELEANLAGPNAEEGLAGTAWEAPHQWTDEELAQIDADLPDENREPRSAADVMAEEATLRESRVAEMDRYAGHLGVAPVRTMAQLLDFVTACGILIVDSEGRYDLNPAAPLPGEVLPLSPEEAQLQDEMRWEALHERTAQEIIRLFEPDSADRPDEVVTSLERLARRLDLTVESVREGIPLLLRVGDFTASADVATISPHRVFTLRVDWDRFCRARVGIRVNRPDEA